MHVIQPSYNTTKAPIPSQPMITKLSMALPWMFILNIVVMESPFAVAADSHASLDVQIEGEGVAIIHAHVKLPGPPDLIFTILTDYTNWPRLFPEGLEIQVERPSEHVVITEMMIPHKVLPSTIRLKTKSIETPYHKLKTKLLDGDYLQYDQVWNLTPLEKENATHAALNLTVQPAGWIVKLVPAFLYRWLIKVDLEDHFEKLRRQVLLKNGKN